MRLRGNIGAIAFALHFFVTIGGALAAGCIYCSCNQRLYAENQLEQCQRECRPGLGCFTGICQSVQVPGDNPTPEQDERQRNAWPNLQCYSVAQQPCDDETSCPVQNYNCIADAIGVTDRLVWREVDGYGDRDSIIEVSDFDNFFGFAGYRPSSDCAFAAGRDKIALYGERIIYTGGSIIVPRHAARQLPTGLFESKEGKYKKVRHGLQDLAGGRYGEVIKCYER